MLKTGKKLPKGSIDAEIERLLDDQAATLISTLRDDANGVTGDSTSEAIAPIDRLTRDMYDLLVGDEGQPVAPAVASGADDHGAK